MKQYYPSCKTLLSGAALLLVAGLAQAQYVWVDEKGIKQFSDRSPPSSIPDKNILKAPGKRLPALEPVAADVRPAPAADAQKQPLTVAERNVDYKKRMAEQAEAAKKKAIDAEQKTAKAEHCASARAYKAQLDSGARIGVVGKNGEQAFMSDAERAQGSAKATKILAECK
ncbi:MAG: DUF4124 domain-containing protein [Telluria sp.]